jgi:hypothetical protein
LGLTIKEKPRKNRRQLRPSRSRLKQLSNRGKMAEKLKRTADARPTTTSE